jgi:hypothetical protein
VPIWSARGVHRPTPAVAGRASTTTGGYGAAMVALEARGKAGVGRGEDIGGEGGERGKRVGCVLPQSCTRWGSCSVSPADP